MFDFEKLDVYQVVREQNIKVLRFLLKTQEIDTYIKDQWKKASMGILLNLAEATGRMNDVEKRNFLVLSRGGVFESVAILEVIKDLSLIEEEEFKEFYDSYEKQSKMLLGMYRSYLKDK